MDNEQKIVELGEHARQVNQAIDAVTRVDIAEYHGLGVPDALAALNHIKEAIIDDCMALQRGKGVPAHKSFWDIQTAKARAGMVPVKKPKPEIPPVQGITVTLGRHAKEIVDIAESIGTVSSTEPEPPEVKVYEDSAEFWDLADIKPLNKTELIEVAEQENIKIDKKALKADIYKKVKKGLGL